MTDFLSYPFLWKRRHNQLKNENVFHKCLLLTWLALLNHDLLMKKRILSFCATFTPFQTPRDQNITKGKPGNIKNEWQIFIAFSCTCIILFFLALFFFNPIMYWSGLLDSKESFRPKLNSVSGGHHAVIWNVLVCVTLTLQSSFNVLLPLGSLLQDNFLTVQIHCIFSILTTTYQAPQQEGHHQCTFKVTWMNDHYFICPCILATVSQGCVLRRIIVSLKFVLL